MGSDQQANLYRVLIERLRAYAEAGDLERAKEIARTAVEASRRSSRERDEDVPLLVDALREFAGVHLREHDLDSALAFYREALDVTRGSKCIKARQLAELKGEYATALDMQGDTDQALSFYLESIDVLERPNKEVPLISANLRNNLGMIYRQRGDLESAETHYLKALEVFEHYHGPCSESVASMHNNIGALYQAASHLDRALEMHMRARDLRLRLHGAHGVETGQSLSNIAAAYHAMEKSEEAAIYYLRALRALREHEDSELFQITSENLEVLKEQYPDVATIKLTEETTESNGQSMISMPL